MASVLGILILFQCISVTYSGENQLPCYGNTTWGRSEVSSQYIMGNGSLPKNNVSELEADISIPVEPFEKH